MITIGFELMIGAILAWYAWWFAVAGAVWLIVKITEHRDLIAVRIKQAVAVAIVFGAIAMFAAAHHGL